MSEAGLGKRKAFIDALLVPRVQLRALASPAELAVPRVLHVRAEGSQTSTVAGDAVVVVVAVEYAAQT
jgi:hypothetical protein